MAIAGQTPLTTIVAAKDLELAYQPLLLVEIGPFRDELASMLYLATENLDSTDGGIQYDGKDYRARILNQDVGSIQAVSDNGIVQSPSITLQIADPDNFIWSTYEVPDTMGFKGIKVVLRFVFWDAGTSTFSEDSRTVFVGICNPPSKDAASLTLNCTSLLNMTKSFLPAVRIQRRCPWVFPSNKADRVKAALDEDSDFWECGYSPDVTDEDGFNGTLLARGNMNGGEAFIDCGNTFSDCIERLGNVALATRSTSSGTPLRIERDTSNRVTGRFGGIQWDAPDGWRGRAFATGEKEQGTNQPNEAKYNDFFPMILGTSFVEPPVMNVLGDANSTRMEVVLCVGQIHDSHSTPGPVEAVLVNDFFVPHSSETTDALLSWNWVNTGDRDGSPNRSALYDGAGDPYGSLACIVITVHRKMHDSTTVPRVRVLTKGPALRQWDDSGDPANFTREWTGNPVWGTAELLTWAAWKAEQLKLETFNAEAAYCTPLVTYTDLTGEEATHERYQLGIALRDRRSVADVLRVVLAGYKALLRPNPVDGKLELLIKKTLADQQPAPIEGSNYNQPVISADATEAAKDGFVAYHFTESEILWIDRLPSLTITQRPIPDTPNRIACAFQNQDYYFTNDTLVKIDAEDVGRSGQEVGGALSVEGVINFDQAARAIETTFAENYRANPRTGYLGLNDTGGSWMFEFVTTSRCVHLAVGDICGITFPKYGLENMQLIRIMAIQPSTNYDTVRIRALWHEDDWYLDRYGQHPDPLLQQQRRNRLLRPPFGWSPNMEAPHEDNQMFSPTEKTFALAQLYEAAADGTAITKLRVWGKLPVNSFSKKIAPPYAPTATYGGSGDFPAGTCYFALSAQDADGNWTAPSWPLAKKAMPGATGATIPNIFWQSGTSAWKLYGGYNPNKLTLQASGSGTPASVNAEEYKVSDEGMPDVQFNHLRHKVKRVFHSGVFGVAINAVSGNTVTVSGASFTAGQWIGYDASVLGQLNDSQQLGVWDFRITGNTATTITFDAGDLEALGIMIGDALVMRTKPDIVSENTIGDSGFVNSIDYYDTPLNVYAVSNGDDSPIAVVTTVPHGLDSGDEVIVSDVLGNTAANGRYTITVYEPSAFTLNGTTGNGDYEGGGKVQRITSGMGADDEIGRLVRIIAGTGRGQVRRIIGNTETTLTIEGTWDTLPDETSRFIVEEDGWLTTSDTTPVENTDPEQESITDILTENFLEQVVLVKSFTVSADGRESIDTHSPEREIYLFGGPGTLQPQYVHATYVLYDTEAGENVTNLLPVRRGGNCVSAAITVKEDSTSAFSFDIFLARVTDLTTRTSILTTKLVVPAGTPAGTVIAVTDFVEDPLTLNVDDVLSGDILVGNTDDNVYTVVLKWEVKRSLDEEE